MQLSRAMAGFTRGQADSLRKAIGKKIESMMVELKALFIEGCMKNEITEATAKKVWSDWEAFANYAFNKSHSTCYAYLAYRCAYLKAHYPAEFYAAVLSRNLSNIKEITYYIDECRHHGIPVLGPDINESSLRFTVNKKGEVRFGLAAMKGVGEAAVEAIISERMQNGPFSDIFDFAKRVNLRAVNKRNMEAMAMAGAFDSFTGVHRAQYFVKKESEELNFIEKLIKHIGMLQTRATRQQTSLFGEEDDARIPDPEIPQCEPLSTLEQLRYENEVIGFFMSGHPLDLYQLELENFTNTTLEKLKGGLQKLKGKDLRLGGMVTSVNHRISKSGNGYGNFILEDFSGTFQFALFGELYMKFKHLLEEGGFLFVRAMVDKRYKSEELEIKIQGVELLAEVLEKHTKTITLYLSLEELDDPLADEIAGAIRNFSGPCPVKFKVFDKKNNQVLDLRSKNHKVFAPDFIRWIHEKGGVKFKLN